MAADNELASLVINMRAETAELRGDIKRVDRRLKRFNRDTRKVSDGVVKSFKAMFGVVVVNEIKNFISSTIDAAAAIEEQNSLFHAVFRDQSEATRRWADDFGKDVGRSSYALQGFAAGLQDTFVPLGFAREEGARLSRQLVELGVDLSSFKNIGTEETFDNMISGLVGNHEAWRRFGVIVTESRLKQELMNMGLADSVQKATEQQKVLARLNILLNSTADAHGDAARTAGSYTNQTRALEAAWFDLKVELGEGFLPVATEVTHVLRNMVAAGRDTDEIASNFDGIGEELFTLAKGVISLGPILKAAFDTLVELALGAGLAISEALTLDVEGASRAWENMVRAMEKDWTTDLERSLRAIWDKSSESSAPREAGAKAGKNFADGFDVGASKLSLKLKTEPLLTSEGLEEIVREKNADWIERWRAQAEKELEDYSDALNETNAILLEIENDRFKGIKRQGEAAFADLGDAVADWATGAEFNVERVAKSITSRLINDALNNLYKNFISAAIFGGGGFGGGLLGGLFGGFRADGGPVAPGKAYVVGEQGPELFVPKAAGMIDPGSARGGTVINQTNNFHSAGFVETAKKEIEKAAPQIANAAMEGVARQARSGGSYSRAIRGG